MQFRQQGHKTQVLAYRGYDKTRKRAVVQLLGSFDRHNPVPSDELLTKLTDDEKSELQSHCETIRQSRLKSVRQYHASTIATRIDELTDSLTSSEHASLLTTEAAADAYRALDQLAKRLRKLGHRRPIKAPTVTPKSV